MPIVIIDNFTLNKTGPIDDRIIATNSTVRSDIAYKYDGMRVFQTDNRSTYVWSASASTWVDETGLTNTITGTGSYGFTPVWSSGSTIVDSFIFTTQSSTLNGYAVGKVGINTPISGTMSPRGTFQINPTYAGSAAPPIVINKGDITTIGENWYDNSGDQVFDTTKGSTLLEFNGSNLSIKTRSANNPVTTYNKLKVTPYDLEVSLYEGNTPPAGTILGSVVARSLYYGYNTSAIKFLSAGSWSSGVYPTDIVFYSMSAATQSRTLSLRNDGTFIVGGNSTHSNDKMLIQGSGRIQGTMSVEGITTTNGIQFPSTQVSSSDANTLDDYEEGSWTPIISGDVSGFTYSSSGHYTKIGRVVHMSGYIKYGTITSVPSGSENNYMSILDTPLGTGVPTTSASVGVWSVNPNSGSSAVRFYGSSVKNGMIISSYQVVGNSNLYFSTTGPSSENPLGGDFTVGDIVSFSMTFQP